MKQILFLLSTLYATTGISQEANELELYLKEHQTHLTQNANKLQVSDGLSAFVSNKMNGKRLLVLGESSTPSPLNGQVWMLLQEQLADKGLKHCFMEDGRATCMLANEREPADLAFAGKYKAKNYTSLMETRIQEKNLYQQTRNFDYVGLDLERPWSFYPALSAVLQKAGANTQARVYREFPYLKQGHFDKYSFHQSYRQIKKNFYKDSSKLKQIIPDQFEALKYLVSNEGISNTRVYRAKYMADNLLDKIGSADTSNIYLLNCSFAHATPGSKGNLVNRLWDTKELKDKIVVLNVYCDSCGSKEQENRDDVIKKDALTAIRNAASDDIVLFDLSQLPAKYSKLKEHGDLLLYARNVQTASTGSIPETE